MTATSKARSTDRIDQAVMQFALQSPEPLLSDLHLQHWLEYRGVVRDQSELTYAIRRLEQQGWMRYVRTEHKNRMYEATPEGREAVGIRLASLGALLR
jgi:hypothetical protein